ncbi:MAG: lipid A export permease/ATP-binding protein MsbA [Gammaproteobacteria bacterium]|nr:lipid A export permease/ATP-binding protein MsbA [Gammaproteobacteria bacterium]MCY4219743.1 lipid A export permease/ATP-binding protein MsbA [Gammaproteobacteria bacterium]MCY4273883.1 lipid A export permease/ATP-binding protein MsbA [Gammaproteobacteria bacterium]
MPKFDEPPSNKALYWRLIRHILPYKGVFLVALSGMILVAAADTGFAWILQPLMDEGFVGRDPDFIRIIPIILLLIAFARAFGDFIDTYCLNWVSRKVIQDLRQVMFENLMYAPTEFYDRETTGSLVSRLTFDVEQVANASGGALRIVFKDLVKVIFLLGLMFYLSWQLSLIFMVIVPAAILIFARTSESIRRISMHIQESVGDISHIAKQVFQSHRVVKLFDAYSHEKGIFFNANNHNRQQIMKRVMIVALSVPTIVLLMGIGIAIVIWLALQFEIKPGVFTSYLVAMTMVVAPVKNLLKINEIIQAGLAAATSIFRMIDLEGEPDNGTRILDSVVGNVSFNSVSFRYSSDSAEVIRGVEFDIPAGATIALVGPSGAGKSTLASMLLRLYTPTEGKITIDGIPINELTIKSLRDNVSLVSQDILLFDDTLRNNITYGRTGPIDQERLNEVCDASYITDFIKDLKNGQDTLLGESGLRLSGGQRQRVAIARALYKDSRILLMDEATSSLDSNSELYIHKAIERLISDRTTLVIAHRLSTVQNADRILVINRGQIIEQGTHDELIQAGGLYTELVNSQFLKHSDVQ